VTGVLRCGLVGLGKIARDEHIPAIASHPALELVAVASRNASAEGVPTYRDLEQMLLCEPEVEAIILCQPPQARFKAARKAIQAGKHVFLEKPPGATVLEVEALVDLARRQGTTMFASWHSRWSEQVAHASRWCASRIVTGVAIEWKEDVRRWHPGQDWMWEAGGFGVFDPAINALSILTQILPTSVRLLRSDLAFPSNRAAPIAAKLVLETADGAEVTAAFDWRQTGAQIWRIELEAGAETFVFQQGAEQEARLPAGSTVLSAEYHAMYRHFDHLVRAGKSDVDLTPLKIVADAFLKGRIEQTDPFHG
jgi:predicted dehydrogenase